MLQKSSQVPLPYVLRFQMDRLYVIKHDIGRTRFKGRRRGLEFDCSDISVRIIGIRITVFVYVTPHSHIDEI